MADINELITRWDAFLEKIEIRFNQSLVQAEEATLDLLDENDYDYQATYVTCDSINTQIQDLLDKIEDTWDEKIADEVDTDDLDDEEEEAFDDAYDRGRDLRDRLEEELEDYVKLIEAKLADKYYEHVMADGLPTFECTQCGSELTPKENVFIPHHVTCTSCNTVNSFKPDAKYEMLNGTAEARVRVKLNDMYKADKAAYEAVKDKLGEPEDEEDRLSAEDVEAIWEAYHEIYMNYHRAYFTELSKLDPMEAERFDENIQRKEDEFLMHYKKTVPYTSK